MDSGGAEACADGEPFLLLGRRMSPAFDVRVVLLAIGRQRAFEERDWRDALIVLERGELEIECVGSTARRFAPGAVVCLRGLRAGWLRQRGERDAVLVAVRRRGGSSMEERSDRNRRVIEEFRANGGRVAAFARQPLLLLHHRGAKTGTWRVNPLAQQELPNGWAVFASKGGAPTNPDWFHNLVANADAKVEVGTATVPVRARVATGEERERIWGEQKRRNHWFAEYERKTTREIPIVVLEPTGDAASSDAT